jgi:hypothetical protein
MEMSNTDRPAADASRPHSIPKRIQQPHILNARIMYFDTTFAPVPKGFV